MIGFYRNAAFITSLLIAVLAFATCYGQTNREVPPDAKQHIVELIKDLPNNSPLRTRLMHGGRGNGIHQPWMGEMRREHVRQAMIWVDITFDKHGRPKDMKVAKVRYFEKYDDQRSVVDGDRLALIRANGLEVELTRLALERAEHGSWLDVPNPRPNPFNGAARLEFLDDEWLPVFESPMYCAGDSCLGEEMPGN
jgi:hypothetical protein